MGKKLQGAKLRAVKRAREAVNELQERQAEQAINLEDAIVVDKTGETVPKRPAKKFKPKTQSVLDETKIKKLQQQYTKEELQKQIAATKKPLKGRTHTAHATQTGYDLWESEAQDKAATTAKRNQPLKLAGIAPPHTSVVSKVVSKPKPQVAVDPAQPGQSYHPDSVSHQKSLQTAIAIEQARNQKQKYKDTPVSIGMKPETKALLVGDSDSDDDDDDKSLDDAPIGDIPKRANKLTRAQRNKQRRHQQMLKDHQRSKEQKQFLHQFHQINKIAHELDQQQQIERHKHSKSSSSVLGTHVEAKRSARDPLSAPTLPVALRHELRGSLRSIQPKGSLATDRVESLLDRQHLLTRNPRTNRRRKKKYQNKGTKGDTYELLGV